MEAPFAEVFNHLRKILADWSADLVCVTDLPGQYFLNTTHIMNNKMPLFFGAAKIGKNYVSYHLMPVYVFPDLLEDVSPALISRMQGKSCFNFKSPDEELFAELKALTAAGFERYQQAGYV